MTFFLPQPHPIGSLSSGAWVDRCAKCSRTRLRITPNRLGDEINDGFRDRGGLTNHDSGRYQGGLHSVTCERTCTWYREARNIHHQRTDQAQTTTDRTPIARDRRRTDSPHLRRRELRSGCASDPDAELVSTDCDICRNVSRVVVVLRCGTRTECGRRVTRTERDVTNGYTTAVVTDDLAGSEEAVVVLMRWRHACSLEPDVTRTPQRHVTEHLSRLFDGPRSRFGEAWVLKPRTLGHHGTRRSGQPPSSSLHLHLLDGKQLGRFTTGITDMVREVVVHRLSVGSRDGRTTSRTIEHANRRGARGQVGRTGRSIGRHLVMNEPAR